MPGELLSSPPQISSVDILFLFNSKNEQLSDRAVTINLQKDRIEYHEVVCVFIYSLSLSLSLSFTLFSNTVGWRRKRRVGVSVFSERILLCGEDHADQRATGGSAASGIRDIYYDAAEA